ncbi:MAG: hypothetical protein HFH67_12100 [Lachnospiraceae bacterium]|nr:hypothetical protein [Lachnospiraceae bacterium]
MQTRKWLEEGFCPVDRYNCLMPVEYEAEEKNGKVKDFHKKRMACRHILNGNCDKETECVFFQNSPDVLAANAIWYDC